MKKLFILLAFIICATAAFSQKIVYRSNGANTIVDARWGAALNLYVPVYLDTLTANDGANIGIDSCGALISTRIPDQYWRRACNPKRWEAIGGGTSNTDSLFGVQDNVASANRSFDLGGNNFTYTGEGNFILGDANTILSSTAKLQVKGHPRTNIVAFGNQPVDGIPLSMFNVDTVTTANLSSQPGRWAQIDRRLAIQDNNLTISDKSGSIINLGLQGKDSTVLNSQGGDLLYGVRGSMFMGKYPGFSGRTVYNSGTSDFDAVPATLAYMATSGGTSSLNNIRMRGYYSGVSSYLNITNAGDTVDRWMGFISNGQIQGKILKSYGFYAGSLASDSGWAFYAPYATERNYFAGNVAIGGGNTGPTNALEVAGKVRIVDGTQSNGYVLTSDANGVASWAAASGGGGLSGGNLGSGYRLYVPGSSGIKTITTTSPSSIVVDSVTANQINVKLSGDANTDSTSYTNLGGKGWTPSAIIPTSGKSPGMVPVWQGGSLFSLQSITSTPGGSNTYVQFNRNGSFSGVDSLTWDATGLGNKYRYNINSVQVVWLPNQTNNLNSVFFGNGGGSLTHTTGITGQYLTVTGIGAGASLTSGSETVINGARACNSCNTITESVVIGSDAGFNFTGAARYVAIGKGAQQNGATPSSGVAIGWQSLFNNTGNFNVGVGAQSLFTNSSGTHNTAVGFQSGYFNATGSGNTYLGEVAGTGVTGNNNSNNTGVGYKALNGVTTGSFNTVFGDSAAYTLTSGNGNIVIGRGMLTSSTTASSEMNIGGLLFGTGMTATGTSTAGNLGIGVAPGSISARVMFPAGTSSASTAATKYVSGTLLGTIEAGAGEYNNAFYLSTNALNRLGVVGVIYSASDSVVNNSTNPTTLMTVTTKASTLSATNESIRTIIRGTFNDAAATATMALTFAGTNILSIAPAGNPTGWRIEVVITRTGASTAQAMVDFYDDLEFHNSVTTQLTGLTFTNTNALVLTGTSSTGAARTIVRNQYRMYWEPAAAN